MRWNCGEPRAARISSGVRPIRESSDGRASTGTIFDLAASKFWIFIFCVGRGLRFLSLGRASGIVTITRGSSVLAFSDVLQPDVCIIAAK